MRHTEEAHAEETAGGARTLRLKAYTAWRTRGPPTPTYLPAAIPIP